MKKLLAIAILLAGTLVMVSCGDDDDPVITFDQPGVTVNSSGNIENGGTGTVVFAVTLDSDLNTAASWTLVSTGVDAATIGGATSGTIDASGNVTVDVTAGTTAGPASVTLTVTNPSQDPAGLSNTATAVFAVNAPGDNAVDLVATVQNTDDDPPSDISALISEGDGISLPGTVEAINGDFVGTFTVAALDGLASLTVTIDGGTPVELLGVAGVTDGAGTALVTGVTAITGIVIPGSAISDAYNPGATNTFTFTAEDTDGDDDSQSISVDIAEAVGNYEATAATDLQGNAGFEVIGEIGDGQTIDFTADNVYILTGRLIVGNGGTLNVAAGTIIKAETGAGVNAKALIVADGGTLNMNGTAAAPIIMTSINDGISPSGVAAGNFVGTLSPDVSGLWGGLIVLGDAPIKASAERIQIEGIPTSVTQGLYGGSDATHDAGTIRYLSLRHGGSNIGAGNEINGISFGGVGSDTEVAWIEIVANQDDGLEWFGGSVDLNGAVIWNSGDDSMDTDQDWTGTATNFYIVTPDGSAFELDGPEGGNDATGVHTFTDGTVYAGNRIGNLVDWDDATNAGLTDILFFGIEAGYYSEGSAIASFGGDGVGTTDNWEIILPGTDTAAGILGADAAAITTVVDNLAAATVGATSTSAAGFEWTLAAQSGALTDIGL